MSITTEKLLRYLVTIIIVILALVVAYELWKHYMVEPWTRDGRVRGNVVQVAPDVSGLVTDVRVHDNQIVNAGDLLFVIDHDRYALAEKQAEAAITSVQTQLDQVEREIKRNSELGDLVATEQKEQTIAKRDQLNAALAQDQVALDTAKLNLSRTEVRASVNGRVTNLELRPGSYASAGRPVMALIDLQSIYVVGYFEETKVDQIHVGDAVRIHLMGSHDTLHGHVDSIAGGIEDRELGASNNLLANVNPTFNWVRLAQRIPVRVHLDADTDMQQLILGRTASVDVISANQHSQQRPASGVKATGSAS